jgi:YspA, cpYpsA-related SLOG family
MRVLVCGGRQFEDRDILSAALDHLSKDRGFSRVISGGALGADTLAEEWAETAGLPTTVYHADWEKLGRKAGPIRNQQKLDESRPELLVAFPGGPGTADMVGRARAADIEVIDFGVATP